MSGIVARFSGICLPKALFFVAVVVLWAAQPVRAQSTPMFSFGDSVPSFSGGSYLKGVPTSAFIDTGENRFEKAGRVFGETIGGVRGIADDFLDIAAFPVREPILFGVAVAGIGALVATDYQVTSFYQDKIESAFDGFSLPSFVPSSLKNNTVLRYISREDEYLLAGIGLTYAYGFAANDERAQATAILASKAVAYSYVISHVLLKPVFGRLRPANDLSSYGGPVDTVDAQGFTPNPYKFGNFPGINLRPTAYGTAMPSFHYTLYFSVARVYSGMYDNAILPYVAAGLLSVSNIRGHNHWVSDMVAGAVIGTVIGQSILDNYTERKGLDMSFTPVVSSRGVGAQFSMRF
jgi:membrane-associated phospholipid phosphatase